MSTGTMGKPTTLHCASATSICLGAVGMGVALPWLRLSVGVYEHSHRLSPLARLWSH